MSGRVRQQDAGDHQQLGLASGELQPVEILIQSAGAALGQPHPGQGLFQHGVVVVQPRGQVRPSGCRRR